MSLRGAGAVRIVLALAFALSLAACSHGQPAPEKLSHAELGVFYGGEVQERLHVEMPSDRPRPTLGFRLTMASPLQNELGVRWEIDMPGPADRRVQNVGEARVPAGQARFDQVIAVPENARLGTWNVRVTAGDRIVIDRAMVLED